MKREVTTNQSLCTQDYMIGIENFPKLDGEIDDTNRIQRALDRIRARGVGVLSLKGETYCVSGRLTIYSNTLIEGVGHKTLIDARQLPVGTTAERSYLFQALGMAKGTLKFKNDLVEGQTVLQLDDDLSEAKVERLLSLEVKNPSIQKQEPTSLLKENYSNC